MPGGWQRTLVEKVAPALMTARAQGKTEPADYERAHVSAVVDQLHHRVEGLDELIAENRLGVVGLRYLLSDSGLEVVEAHGVEA